MGLSIIFFKYKFGLEKDRHYNSRFVINEVFICLLIFFIIYYLLGLKIGFYKIENYLTLYGMKTFIIPLILKIVLGEILRYAMVRKCGDNKLFLFLTVALFTLLDITNGLYFADLNTNYHKFIFVATIFLPSVMNNTLCTYLTCVSGYKPVIFYLFIINLYKYLIPIVPNLNNYLYSIVFFLLPIVLLFRIYNYLDKEKDKFNEAKGKHGKYRFLVSIPLFIFLIFLIGFTSGYFKYYGVAIASGSMRPNINIGDIVVIEKLNQDDIKNLKVGEVLAYKYHDVMMVHRIVDIKSDKNKVYFYTKGDANKDIDGYPISIDMIIGKVNTKIPYLGLPTVWLNDLG